MVTGLGLAGVIRRRYSRWVLWGACTLLVVANVINIAADLGGMAEATKMVTGAPVVLMVPVYGVVIVALLMWSSYRSIARVFKWLDFHSRLHRAHRTLHDLGSDGYLAREDAAAYRLVLAAVSATGKKGVCRAKLIGGTSEKPSIGVMIDLLDPDALLARFGQPF